MRFFAVALFFFGAASYGQAPEVPHKMQFAGMTLTIRDDARREIQKDVDALTQHPRYFNVKVERAKTYFPIIEKIFAEERLPNDFKFLALQESALVSDAVSVSDAVGFWQFKDFTALEMGLRVDKDVDERMNLVSATHAAARYLKQNNYMFNNWLYALQAYQMGAGGVQRAVGDQHNGAKHMEISSETYWYVKKYLAHKVAFENAIAGEAQLKVIPFETLSGKSIPEIAVEVAVEELKLLEFNKWLKNGLVPSDKSYTVLIPVGELQDFSKLIITASTNSKNSVTLSGPDKGGSTGAPEKLEEISVNEIPVIKAKEGETLMALANRAKIDVSSFLKYNDISGEHVVAAGSYYFLERKKVKSKSEYYTTVANEDVWTVSQHTGVQLKKLVKYNGFVKNQKIEEGSVVWLNGLKPTNKSMPETDVVALVDDEEFDWNERLERENVAQVRDNPTKQLSQSINAATQQDSTNAPIKVLQAPEYVVQPGETLYSIAKKKNVDVMSLIAWNKLTMADGLKPGQVLKLAPLESATNETRSELSASIQIHEVQASDTLYSVSRKYGVTIKELLDWNEKKDLSLTVGEKLRIPQK
jgi:membrane-bound lytic murein transglycosylase D